MSIPEPLVLPYSVEQDQQAYREAQRVYERYETGRNGAKSVFETAPIRIWRGFIAEIVLADHFGKRRADPDDPRAYSYDVAPNLEIRATEHPRKIDWWESVCITLYEKDMKKRGRRWVLAVIDTEARVVRFMGWADTSEFKLPEPAKARSRAGNPYLIYGVAYPDQLHPMEEAWD